MSEGGASATPRQQTASSGLQSHSIAIANRRLLGHVSMWTDNPAQVAIHNIRKLLDEQLTNNHQYTETERLLIGNVVATNRFRANCKNNPKDHRPDIETRINSAKSQRTDKETEQYWSERHHVPVPIQIGKHRLVVRVDTGCEVPLVIDMASAKQLGADFRALSSAAEIAHAQLDSLSLADGTPVQPAMCGLVTVRILCTNGNRFEKEVGVVVLPHCISLIGLPLLQQIGVVMHNLPTHFIDEEMHREKQYCSDDEEVDPEDDFDEINTISKQAGIQAPKELLEPLMNAIQPLLDVNKAIPATSQFTGISPARITTPEGKSSFTPQFKLNHRDDEYVLNWAAELESLNIVEVAQPGTAMYNRCRDWNIPIMVATKIDPMNPNQRIPSRAVAAMMAVNKILIDIAAIAPRAPAEVIEHMQADGENIYTNAWDFIKCFYQVPVHHDDRHKLAFRLSDGKVRYFTRLPMGMKHSVHVMQSILLQMLDGLTNVEGYIDNVYNWAKNIPDLIKYTVELLQRLNKHHARLQTAKTLIGYIELAVLGYMVKGQIKSVEPAKLTAIMNWPRPLGPKGGKAMSTFIGFVGFIRDTIPELSTILAVLEPLKQKKYIAESDWSQQAMDAFNLIKEVVATKINLHAFDKSLPLFLATDASLFGLGAVLYQIDPQQPKVKRYLFFASKSLRAGQIAYSATRRELLAVVYGLKKFKFILFGRHFTLLTDHAALVFMFANDHSAPMLWDWSDTIHQFDFIAVHCPGVVHVLPDIVSRLYEAYYDRYAICDRSNIRKEALNYLQSRRVTSPTRTIATLTTSSASSKTAASPVFTFTAPHVVEVVDHDGNTIDEDEFEHPPQLQLIYVADDTNSSTAKSISAVTKQSTDTPMNTQIFEMMTKVWQPLAMIPAESHTPAADQPQQLPQLQVNAAVKADSKANASPEYVQDAVNTIPHLRQQQFLKGVAQRNEPAVEERMKLIKAVHDGRGHIGLQAVYQCLWDDKWWWPTMHHDIAIYLKKCQPCTSFSLQRNGYHPAQFIHAIEPMEHVTMDLGMVPLSIAGFQYILVLADVATGFTFLDALKNKEAESVCRSVYQIFRRFGFPVKMQSDNGTEFANSVMTKFTELADIKQLFGAPMHPECQGTAERRVGVSKHALGSTIHGDWSHWEDYLPLVEIGMNTRIVRRTGSSSFSLMLGRSSMFPPKRNQQDEEDIQIDDAELVNRCKLLQHVVWPEIGKRSEQHRKTYTAKLDQHRLIKKEALDIGTHVKLRDFERSLKSSPQFVGNYIIEKVVRSPDNKFINGYHIKNVGDNKILMTGTGANIRPRVVKLCDLRVHDPELENDTPEVEFQVEKILDVTGQGVEAVYLTKFKGYDEPEWIQRKNFVDQDIIEKYHRDVAESAKRQSSKKQKRAN